MHTSTKSLVFPGARAARVLLSFCLLFLIFVLPLRAPAAACGNTVLLATSDPSAVEKYQAALQAAHAGDFRAQIALAGMYRGGQGVTPDLVRAYAWLNFAAVRHREAAVLRDEVARCLDPGQDLEAQLLSVQLLSSVTAR
ncbi:MAG: hypothetical protein RID42_09060 [Alphaproteobacteria bacterium]